MSLPLDLEPDLRPPADPLGRANNPSAHGQASKRTEAGLKPFGEDGFSFFDLIDIVNPLQHIPVVSTIYRRITGDTLDPLPRIAGGALFGGVIGFATSAVNAMIDGATGKDIGEHVLAFLGDPLAPEAGEPASDLAYTADFPPGARDRGSAAPQTLVTEAQLGVVPVTAEILPEISLNSTPPFPPADKPVTGVGKTAERPTGRPPLEGIDFQQARAPAADDPTRPSPPPDDGLGGIADDGGWFTLIMLQALEKYEAGARLGSEESRPKPTVSILQ